VVCVCVVCVCGVCLCGVCMWCVFVQCVYMVCVCGVRMCTKILMLRSIRGVFTTTGLVTSQDAGAGNLTPDTAAVTFAPKDAAPFGTFAGGTFFLARGVLITDFLAADENNWQATPVEGGTKSRPQAFTITVTNLVGTDETTLDDDRVAVWRLTGSGGSIDKTEHSCAGGEAIGDSTITVDVTIPSDVPGKVTGGVLKIRDASDNNKGYRIRFSSYTGAIFTLANVAFVAEGGTTTTHITDVGSFTNARRGDLILNTSRANAISYITDVVDNDNCNISPAIAAQTTGDNIEINAVPVALNTADDLYVALIDQHALGTTVSVSIVVGAEIFFRVKVRNSANATKILPFSTDGSTGASPANQSIATIRNEDTIAV